MQWKINIIKAERTKLTIVWLSERPYRPQYNDGYLCAVARPFFECGSDERTVDRIYYIGLCRFAILLLRRPKKYSAFWDRKKTNKVNQSLISLSSYKMNRRKKHAPITQIITR